MSGAGTTGWHSAQGRFLTRHRPPAGREWHVWGEKGVSPAEWGGGPGKRAPSPPLPPDLHFFGATPVPLRTIALSSSPRCLSRCPAVTGLPCRHFQVGKCGAPSAANDAAHFNTRPGTVAQGVSPGGGGSTPPVSQHNRSPTTSPPQRPPSIAPHTPPQTHFQGDGPARPQPRRPHPNDVTK